MRVEMAETASPLRVLEFYSGIGGLRYSLKEAGLEAVVVEAFEINEVANDVYEHNFGHRPNQGNIQRLTLRQLDSYKADTWLLSPPCQPYTRQGLRKDSEDARAHSFLQMLEILPQMKSPPHYILVENVVGFENSLTHGQLIEMFEKANFVTQEFILSPLQLGIPYSRPRYFCLAKRKPKDFLQPRYNKSLVCDLGPIADVINLPGDMEISTNNIKKQDAESLRSAERNCVDIISKDVSTRRLSLLKMNEPRLDPVMQCRPVCEFLEEDPCSIDDISAPPLLRKSSGDSCMTYEGDIATMSFDGRGCAPVLAEAAGKWEPYRVPVNVVERWGDCFDIVTQDSKRCCCFTKSYGKYAKGTGSFLATKNVWEDKRQFESSLTTQDLPKGVPISSLGLRYFTPREAVEVQADTYDIVTLVILLPQSPVKVANLHSFPPDFTFPLNVSLKQRYALLGNSLSVAVVGALLRYLFSASSS